MSNTRPRRSRLVVAREWARANLFDGPLNTLATLVTVAFLAWAIPAMVRWLVIDAVGYGGDPEACRRAGGACWAFLRVKGDVILTGTYPFEERWRAQIAAGVTMVAVAVALFWRGGVVGLAGLFVAAFVADLALLSGGIFGLKPVDSTRWNGLPLILFLSVFTMAAALPIGIALALARQSKAVVVKVVAVTWIETIRGIPMVAVLFAGVFILPLLIPPGWQFSSMVSIFVVLTVFHAAYFAEDFRSGLDDFDVGQIEAARSSGLGYRQTLRLVVLPQALRIALPALTNSIIGGFKDTSLVAIVGLYDLMATARMASADVEWQAYTLEGNIVVGLFYLVTCVAVSERFRRMAEARHGH
ncbi:amino acid ABC transporter permease [Siculibacillus lacustris]|uniref:Amino acid ABC transporter permease n=1 Tax=Siculibacillus lacustris TaxID=1549641 RepID=A0A4V2KUC5_9HYPH|nr:amino acid ABC transporter permease [Siculibacillus lacustris]TBW40866.1 amino acid ABC transporter permease [Siculibacillus lacustris]